MLGSSCLSFCFQHHFLSSLRSRFLPSASSHRIFLCVFAQQRHLPRLCFAIRASRRLAQQPTSCLQHQDHHFNIGHSLCSPLQIKVIVDVKAWIAGGLEAWTICSPPRPRRFRSTPRKTKTQASTYTQVDAVEVVYDDNNTKWLPREAEKRADGKSLRGLPLRRLKSIQPLHSLMEKRPTRVVPLVPCIWTSTSAPIIFVSTRRTHNGRPRVWGLPLF